MKNVDKTGDKSAVSEEVHKIRRGPRFPVMSAKSLRFSAFMRENKCVEKKGVA